jgi:hypothetical protein
MNDWEVEIAFGSPLADVFSMSDEDKEVWEPFFAALRKMAAEHVANPRPPQPRRRFVIGDREVADFNALLENGWCETYQVFTDDPLGIPIDDELLKAGRWVEE